MTKKLNILQSLVLDAAIYVQREEITIKRKVNTSYQQGLKESEFRELRNMDEKFQLTNIKKGTNINKRGNVKIPNEHTQTI